MSKSGNNGAKLPIKLPIEVVRDPRVTRPTQQVPTVVVEGPDGLAFIRHTNGAVDLFRPGRHGEDYWVRTHALTVAQVVQLEAGASAYAAISNDLLKAAIRAAIHLHTGRHPR